MTYRKTQKAKRTKLPETFNSLKKRYPPKHKIPYMITPRRDGVSSIDGKYNGYEEYMNIKPPSLKKRVRQASKNLISQGIEDYQDECSES